MTFNYLAGLLLMIPLFSFTLLPFLNGDFHSSNLTYKLNDPHLAWGGLQLALVWIWIMIWSTAPEAAATFAPEYKDTVRDTRKALMSSAAFILVINTLVPVALTGGVGAKTVGAYDYVGALNHLVGKGATNFFVIVICLSFVLSMNTATADGSRALYGISRDGLTIKQLGRLNRFNVPGYAMSLDMGINILFVLFVGNLFGILVASNIGYVLANMFAIGAFVLLRTGPPGLAAADQAAQLLGADRVRALCRVRALQRRRDRLVPDRGRRGRLRRHEKQDHRLLRPCRFAPSVPVPANRPGQGEAALA